MDRSKSQNVIRGMKTSFNDKWHQHLGQQTQAAHQQNYFQDVVDHRQKKERERERKKKQHPSCVYLPPVLKTWFMQMR